MRKEGSQTDACGDSSLQLAEQAAEINSKLDKLLNTLNIVREFDSMEMRLIELQDESRKLKEASEITASV